MRRAAAFLAAFMTLFPAAAAASTERWVRVSFAHAHSPRVVAAEKRALFADVNATRVRHGLAPLVADEGLDDLALAVARHMAEQRYFGHTDPSGVTFGDRLRAAGYQYRYAAENLAFDRDEAHANAAFLQSPGHYQNIVDRHPHKLGIAVLAAGYGEIFYVEEFSD
ncbi:MAG: hypothetical protein JWO85_956 [Candidatus Eremiobacteraeota bacterium]|jgi:uncharacterized protein YkwD|nr:hypothetical protein [Candidatus Eremiobacteraeota bacterium]